MRLPKEFEGEPAGLEESRVAIEQLATDRIIVLQNTYAQAYYAFRIDPKKGVTVKFGSYAKNPGQRNPAYESKGDIFLNELEALDKLSEKWKKFPKHSQYQGNDVARVWNNLVATINGVSPAAITRGVQSAAKQQGMSSVLQEYTTLIHHVARKHGMDKGQLHSAVVGEVYKLNRAGIFKKEHIDAMLEEPRDVLNGRWKLEGSDTAPSIS